jgi:hypothetical protein
MRRSDTSGQMSARNASLNARTRRNAAPCWSEIYKWDIGSVYKAREVNNRGDGESARRQT